MTALIIDERELNVIASATGVISVRESVATKNDEHVKVLVFKDAESFERTRSFLCSNLIRHSALYAANSLALPMDDYRITVF